MIVASSAGLLFLIAGLLAYINLLIATKVARNLVAIVKAKEYVPDKRIPDYGEWRVFSKSMSLTHTMISSPVS